jgi:hypothetical protein
VARAATDRMDCDGEFPPKRAKTVLLLVPAVIAVEESSVRSDASMTIVVVKRWYVERLL